MPDPLFLLLNGFAVHGTTVIQATFCLMALGGCGFLFITREKK
jgi:hypothetical protein